MPFQDQVLLINETLPVRRVEENNYWCEKEEEWSVYWTWSMNAGLVSNLFNMKLSRISVDIKLGRTFDFLVFWTN
jgi:hypothetical protein